jgi:hypothetical protein
LNLVNQKLKTAPETFLWKKLKLKTENSKPKPFPILSARMKKPFLLLVLLLFFSKVFSQDSCTLRISLLTCSPGEELYSTFGHTAIRVSNDSDGTDYVFNYGTFEFNPEFYSKFIRGKLLYYLSVQEFPDFMYAYEWESRSVYEQVLQLNCQDKTALARALYENAKPENRYYKYDFLFDNCTTRARDIIKKSTSPQVAFQNILPEDHPSFRDLIHTYLDNGGQNWSKFGIDLLLGADLDRGVSNEESMFLPDYLLKGIESARLRNSALSGPPAVILKMPDPVKGAPLLHPAVVFSVLFLVILVLSFLPSKKARSFIRFFDTAFFFVLGLCGIILLFMWFGTDHAMCRNNFNLLWAFPLHVVGAFVLYSKKPWISYYLLSTILLSAILLIGWVFLPQELNLSVIPILLLILLRSWLLILKPFSHATENHHIPAEEPKLSAQR